MIHPPDSPDLTAGEPAAPGPTRLGEQPRIHPAKLIVYACPTGELNDQIATYLAASRARFGENAAHRYMPHVTLIGFFQDQPASIPTYAGALDAALARARPTRPTPVVEIRAMVCQESFHGLLLDAPWLRAIVADFVRTADSPTRPRALRPKDQLHLSFAYDFPREQGPGLARLAGAIVDPGAPVRWELRLYEQHPDGCWICHAAWPLD